MDFSRLIIILIFLSLFCSCKKPETKTNISENIANTTPTPESNEYENEISDVYRSGEGEGYGYEVRFRGSDFGKKLAEEQAKLYSKSEKDISEENIILSQEYGFDNLHLLDNKSFYRASREYYINSLKFYKNNDFKKAIEYIEMAIKTYARGVYYYHYGLFLMNNNDYENAEKAFYKAFQFFDYTYPFYEDFIDLVLEYKNPIYTYDNNGSPREIYFTFYNLACIYSIRNETEKALEFVINAIEWGYPYIEHLFNDPDLKNMYLSNDKAKETINTVYQKGFENNISDKIFEYYYHFSSCAFYFENNTNIKYLLLSSDNRQHIYHGAYEIKNYQIIMRFNYETGKRGYGKAYSAGVNTGYEHYEDYSKNIDQERRVLLTGIVRYWEEKTLSDYDYFFNE